MQSTRQICFGAFWSLYTRILLGHKIIIKIPNLNKQRRKHERKLIFKDLMQDIIYKSTIVCIGFSDPSDLNSILRSYSRWLDYVKRITIIDGV